MTLHILYIIYIYIYIYIYISKNYIIAVIYKILGSRICFLSLCWWCQTYNSINWGYYACWHEHASIYIELKLSNQVTILKHDCLGKKRTINLVSGQPKNILNIRPTIIIFNRVSFKLISGRSGERLLIKMLLHNTKKQNSMCFSLNLKNSTCSGWMYTIVLEIPKTAQLNIKIG